MIKTDGKTQLGRSSVRQFPQFPFVLPSSMRRISGRCPQQGGGRNNRNLETSSSSDESSDDDDQGSAVSGPASGIAQSEDRTAVGNPPREGLHRQATAPIATPRRRSPPSRSLDLDDASDVRTFCSHLDLGLPPAHPLSHRD